MGIKSVMNTDRLYWLGRYSERVYTTLKLFSRSFDYLIEQYGDDHKAFCESLEIPDIYRDKDDFIDRYAFSLEDPNSIISNLYRAYDNAIELREEIGSETLSFIQIAIYEMSAAKRSEAPLLHFKIGKRIERLDLYARLKKEPRAIRREVKRLAGRIGRTDLIYSQDDLQKIIDLANAPELDYWEIIRLVEQFVEC